MGFNVYIDIIWDFKPNQIIIINEDNENIDAST